MSNNRLMLFKLLVGVFFAVMAIIIAVTVFYSITRSGTYKVSIVTAPSDSEVVVDGRKVSSDHIYLTPGNHEYLVSRPDFRSYIGTITVTEKGEQYISAALEAVNDEGRTYAATIADQYSAVQTVGGTEAERSGETFTAKNPITKELPYSSPLFNIGYRADATDPGGNAIIITIRASSVYRENALTQIENWGFNPVDYNIEFINERNPFL